MWTAKGENRPKRPKTQKAASRVLASVFWDTHGIVFIDYLEKGRTINSEYYMALLLRLKEEIAKKRPQMKTKNVLFHQLSPTLSKLKRILRTKINRPTKKASKS